MSSHIERAIEKIQVKDPAPPDIDFTLHTLEDGTVISTQERVVKDVCTLGPVTPDPPQSHPTMPGASTRNVQAHAGTVL
jgi:serine/threonine-protein phosphatase 2B catalytic subunit